MAVGAGPGTILVPRVDYSVEENFGGIGLGTWEQGEPVAVETIDGLGLEACHLIKVDVEGMEAEALAGAEQAFRRWHPVLYVENDRREKAALLIQQILDLDYRMYWHFPPLFNLENFFAATENVFGRIVSYNMLCLPPGDPRTVRDLSEIRSPDDVPWQPGPRGNNDG